MILLYAVTKSEVNWFPDIVYPFRAIIVLFIYCGSDGDEILELIDCKIKFVCKGFVGSLLKTSNIIGATDSQESVELIDDIILFSVVASLA